MKNRSWRGVNIYFLLRNFLHQITKHRCKVTITLFNFFLEIVKKRCNFYKQFLNFPNVKYIQNFVQDRNDKTAHYIECLFFHLL